MTSAEIREKTLELYKQLPQDEEGRKARTDIRDQIIELNYKVFGYIAANQHINNNTVTYEDKLQSVIMHFCECWWKFQWEGHYRTDLAFSTFFTPRINEMLRREFNDVKYSTERQLKQEVGNQLGKHWAKVTYEDLLEPNLKIPAKKMESLKAIFGITYMEDIDDYSYYNPASTEYVSKFNDEITDYDDIDGLLINEMIKNESKLSDRHLRKLSRMLDISIIELKKHVPSAERKLYIQLHKSQDMIDSLSVV